MKNKIIFIVILLLTPFFILNFFYPNDYTQSPPFSPAPQQDKFIYGAIQSIWSYPNYDSLSLNTTHCYISTKMSYELNRHVPMGWAGSGDSLTADIINYADDIRNAKNIMYQHNQSRFFYQRPKIEWLAFGQSSTYEAEYVDPGDDMWFYSFNNHDVGDPETDNSQFSGPVPPEVLFCSRTFHSQGFAVRRLKANTEQCKSTQSDGSDNHWQYDTESIWHIKPRIRIDSTVVDNNPNINVCRIIVINQELDTIKNTIIKARNFLDINNNYDGRYLEEFRIFSGDDTLTYKGAWGNWWGLSARGEAPTDSGRNGTDIQVYWYGNCDMWIDRVRVDNDVADELFKGITTNFTNCTKNIRDF